MKLKTILPLLIIVLVLIIYPFICTSTFKQSVLDTKRMQAKVHAKKFFNNVVKIGH